MSLEDLLEKAKKAHAEKRGGKKVSEAEGKTPRVVRLPGEGHITEYDKIPLVELERAEQEHLSSPDDHDARAYLAFLNYAAKNYEVAIQHFGFLLEAGFKPGYQHFYLGNCHYQNGDKAAAKVHWEKSLELAPPEGIARQVRQRLEWVRDR